ncbi:MAG: 2-oxoacid ferredoxin oxidoreductase [Desulfuromonadaceae bacterium]|nr:2-oxoacid ferredoxin oxidoreductase [Desulfuromonadaceae bacterium]
MSGNPFDLDGQDIAWCPGCGNFAILRAVKDALADLDLLPREVVLVSGIGQAAKLPHYLAANFFNGLHGRALPVATAIKSVNPSLTVIAESGDGDMYGEGGNHFIHAIRRNPNITNIIHDNMVYGLTKGQASPTSRRGFQTPVQVHGVASDPINPLTLALSLNASFVARAFAGDIPGTTAIIKKAILHRGYALVDIFQPCVTFNRVNTFAWFKEKTYYLEDAHDVSDRAMAFQRAAESDRLPLGIFFAEEGRPTFAESAGVFGEDAVPLFRRLVDSERLGALIETYRGKPLEDQKGS